MLPTHDPYVHRRLDLVARVIREAVTLGLLLLTVLALPARLRAQSAAGEVKTILSRAIEPRQVTAFQLQQYLLRRAPAMPHPVSAENWTADAEKIRKQILQDVIFHGWPKAWVDAPPKFESVEAIAGGKGFRREKLRYEIVPGMDATAILYAPAKLRGRVPGILVVMGHWAALGNAMEFNQKECINYALRGAVVLNPDWIGMGELNQEGSQHWFAAHLNLVGANGVGLFYLAMRKALDYLCQDPHVDPHRIGMTGLSGGGWQTIVLSSLDQRVRASIPVAGYTTLAGRVERVAVGEPGDLEQNATDLVVGRDYDTLTAMRAPRPTLLLNNTGDDCCFRAPLVKPEIYDPVCRFFALYGAQSAFEFHANTDDPAHNYGLDNREQSYRFFIKYLRLSGTAQEIPVGEEIKTYGELRVGVPKGNLTIIGLARMLGSEIRRQPVPSDLQQQAKWTRSERSRLRTLVRYQPVEVKRIWRVWNTWYKRLESVSYRFELGNGLGATGIWMREVSTPDHAPLTIVLNDNGFKAVGKELWNRVPEVADRLERGEQVLVLDLVFTGDESPGNNAPLFAEMIDSTGERPLGLESAQLLGLARWARRKWNPSRIRVETTGIRSQVQALVAAALDPEAFSTVASYNGMQSFKYLLDKPVKFQAAPDLFCLDLYKKFDVDRLVAVAEPTRVIQRYTVEVSDK